MVQALIITFAVFVGWILLDFVKKKKLTKENIFSSIIVAVLAGLVWFIMELIISFF